MIVMKILEHIKLLHKWYLSRIAMVKFALYLLNNVV